MEQVDFSFMEDGVEVIQEHLITFAIILGLTLIGSIVLFKYLRFPKWLANALTLVIVLLVFVVTAIYYYFPGIINGLS